MPHSVHAELLDRAVQVVMAGCGSQGSAVAAALPYLHRSLLAHGHPKGIDVTIFDGDTISHSSCAVLPFRPSDIGDFKSVVMVDRLNAFWNVEWKGVAENLMDSQQLEAADLVISCTGTARGRAVVATPIHEATTLGYWLDLASHSNGRQFVLGEPLNERNHSSLRRLPTVLELVPELVEGTTEEAEGVGLRDTRAEGDEDVFLNHLLANHALRLLDRLFRRGAVRYHAGFMGPAGGIRLLQVEGRALQARGGRQDA
jgi:sulfur-carrier protein adenylyltransferase/sulfurtransferase